MIDINSADPLDIFIVHEDDFFDGAGNRDLSNPIASLTAVSGSNQISLQPSQLVHAGRYHVVPVNNSTTDTVTVSVTANVVHTIAVIDPTQGLWFNPARNGAGFNLNRNDNTLVFEWYTYLPDGTPTWYLVQASYPQPGNRWKADILFFKWDGNQAVSTVVGEAELLFLDDDSMIFSYRINGFSGSEPHQTIVSDISCQTQGNDVALTGLWFLPGRPGFGYSILSLSGQQIHINYLYDGDGFPRWVYGQGPASGGQQLPMSPVQRLLSLLRGIVSQFCARRQ